MFLLNSRLGLFSAAYLRRHPFSRSYGVILPSSLTTLLPSALGFSPHLPVSVCGTGLHETIVAFLDSLDLEASLLYFDPHNVSASVCRICLTHSLYAYTSFSIPGSSYPSASPQFCSYKVLESQPVVHRLRFSPSP